MTNDAKGTLRARLCPFESQLEGVKELVFVGDWLPLAGVLDETEEVSNILGGTLARSFLLAFDGKITLPEMEKAFDGSNINLLVLSACQTAAGNSRSVLGLSGVALHSNIPNMIGSLWSVEDLDTADSIDSFYTYLKQGFSYAEALQKMQVERIKSIDRNPSNWSSLIVLKN